MQTRLVSIGNSLGVRLPKSLIKQFDLDKGDIELVVKKEGILIIPLQVLLRYKTGISFLSWQRKMASTPKKT